MSESERDLSQFTKPPTFSERSTALDQQLADINLLIAELSRIDTGVAHEISAAAAAIAHRFNIDVAPLPYSHNKDYLLAYKAALGDAKLARQDIEQEKVTLRNMINQAFQDMSPEQAEIMRSKRDYNATMRKLERDERALEKARERQLGFDEGSGEYQDIIAAIARMEHEINILRDRLKTILAALREKGVEVPPLGDLFDFNEL